MQFQILSSLLSDGCKIINLIMGFNSVIFEVHFCADEQSRKMRFVPKSHSQ